MGFLQWSIDNIEIFNSLENILNKSILSLNNIKTKQNISNEDKNNYKFICSLIDYYQSLKNKLNINEKYSYYIISSKTKNISSFFSLKKAKDIFVNWIKLLNKTNNFNNILDNSEIEINKIKVEIINNIKQNKLLNVFQEHFYNYYSNKNNKTFIKLILSGMPDFLRPIIWILILEKNNKNKKQISIKDYLCQNNNTQNLKQINKDINRTFINNKSNIVIDEDKINKLKHILIALSNYNPEIGYTQGMNHIIGFLLKVTNFDEEKAFYLSILIIDKIKGYFIKDFPLLKENLNKFNNEFYIRNNKLYKHFKKYMMPDELWICKWLQTLFTISFPFNEVCRIWDALIIFGFDFIIYLSLAIIYYAEEKLLKLDDSSDFSNYLNEIMNPNPGIKKFIEVEPNYKDYIIPIYSIISRAKKIKREISIEMSYFNSFNKFHNTINLYDTELKENNNYNNYDNQNKQHNYTKSKFINNSCANLVKSNTVNTFNTLKKVEQNNDEKNANNTLEKKNDGIKRNINFSDKNLYNNIKDKNNDTNYNNKKEIKMRKFSDISDCSVNSAININNIISNNLLRREANSNYLKGRNYSYSGIQNVNLNDNNSGNFINGIPRRNRKILIVKKSNPLTNPLDKIQIQNNPRNYVSKSPDYFRLSNNYNYNQIIGHNNNINYLYTQNKVLENYNDFIVNTPFRGSYNISIPNKYCFGYKNYLIQKK